MEEENIDPLCIIVVKSGAQGGKLLFKGPILTRVTVISDSSFSHLMMTSSQCSGSASFCSRDQSCLVLLYFSFLLLNDDLVASVMGP
jgi:hypothetical protein